MEPQIQYATTEDGISIAYFTLGTGAPLVYTPSGPLTNMQMEWEIPAVRSYFELLARKRMVVRYDNRGAGLSGGDLADLDRDAFLLDLGSVADRLGLDRFDLFGSIMFGAAALAYAVQNPERISHLILFNTTARAEEFTSSPR